MSYLTPQVNNHIVQFILIIMSITIIPMIIINQQRPHQSGKLFSAMAGRRRRCSGACEGPGEVGAAGGVGPLQDLQVGIWWFPWFPKNRGAP